MIRETLQASTRLLEICFHAVKRDQNIVAHELAQLAKRTVHSEVWRTQVSLRVRSIVTQECNFDPDQWMYLSFSKKKNPKQRY